jgi:hypothetical protein
MPNIFLEANGLLNTTAKRSLQYIVQACSVFCFTAITTSTLLAQDNPLVAACQAVYATSTANVSTERRRTAELETLHDAMCSADIVKEGFQLDAGLEAIVYGVPIAGDLGINSTKDRQNYICKNFESLRTATAALDTYSKTIVVAALSNFNGCLELASRGVSVQPAVAAPQSLVVKLSLTDPDGMTLQAFAKTNNMNCISPQIEGKDKVIDPAKEYRFKNDFSVACTRSAEKGEKEFYKPGHVNFTTSRSKYPFTFSLAEDELLAPMLASQSKTRIDELEGMANSEKGRADKNQAELNKVNAYTVVTHGYVVGQYNPGGRGSHFGCYTLESVALAQLCPNAVKTAVTHLGSWSGHQCGYAAYTAACLMP